MKYKHQKEEVQEVQEVQEAQEVAQTEEPAEEPVAESFENNDQINYEEFEVQGASEELGAAPVTQTVTVENTDNESDDVLQIDGTDLLAAPLADRFYSVNSIANVNRNASNDLRGDVPIPYDKNYTPFYQSHIQGEPLHTNTLN